MLEIRVVVTLSIYTWFPNDTSLDLFPWSRMLFFSLNPLIIIPFVLCGILIYSTMKKTSQFLNSLLFEGYLYTCKLFWCIFTSFFYYLYFKRNYQYHFPPSLDLTIYTSSGLEDDERCAVGYSPLFSTTPFLLLK